MEFTIPLKIENKLSLNSIYKCSHWANRKILAENIHEMVQLNLLSQKIPRKLFQNPVIIKFSWNSKLDLDNHGYIAKLIIDGFKGYLIYDDSKKYMIGISHEYWDGDGVKVFIDEKKDEINV